LRVIGMCIDIHEDLHVKILRGRVRILRQRENQTWFTVPISWPCSIGPEGVHR